MWKSCHCLKDMVEQVSQKLSLGRSFGLFLELSNNEPVWLFVIMMIRFYFQNTEQTLDWNLWAYCIWFHIVMSFFHLAIRNKKKIQKVSQLLIPLEVFIIESHPLSLVQVWKSLVYITTTLVIKTELEKNIQYQKVFSFFLRNFDKLTPIISDVFCSLDILLDSSPTITPYTLSSQWKKNSTFQIWMICQKWCQSLIMFFQPPESNWKSYCCPWPNESASFIATRSILPINEIWLFDTLLVSGNSERNAYFLLFLFLLLPFLHVCHSFSFLEDSVLGTTTSFYIL